MPIEKCPIDDSDYYPVYPQCSSEECSFFTTCTPCKHMIAVLISIIIDQGQVNMNRLVEVYREAFPPWYIQLLVICSPRADKHQVAVENRDKNNKVVKCSLLFSVYKNLVYG